MLTSYLSSDVVRFRPGKSVKNYCAAADTPLARAAVLRQAFNEALAGDYILIGAGLYDFPHTTGNVLFPDGVTISGLGKDVTKLKSDVWSDKQGTAFVLKNTVVQNMTIECDTYQKNEDGRTIGFDPLPTQILGFKARISNCRLIGNAWTVYNWNNLGNYLCIEDSELIFGRHGVSAMGSGSATSQLIDIYRCKFDGDASRSADVGATSDRNYGGVFGVCARGGRVRVIDCEMNLVGMLPRTDGYPSWVPRVCGVIDTFEAGPSDATKIEIANLRCKVIPNGSPVSNCFDIDLKWPTLIKNLIMVGGYGSGVNGAFLKSF